MTKRCTLRRTMFFVATIVVLALIGSDSAHAAPWEVIVWQRDDYALYEPPLSMQLDGDPPLVVLLHGAPGLVQPWYYDRQARDLADAGYVVILPIYGGAPWDWYRDAVDKTRSAMIDIFLGQVGLTNPSFSEVAVVGHSLGGIYALKFADEAQSLWLPSPKAVILHDAAGYTSLPLVSPLGTHPNWLSDLTGIDDNAVLVVVAAEETWQADIASGFFSGNASAIWLRAWFLTGTVGDKRGYRVPGSHFGNVGFSGTPVYNTYRDITLNALRAAFDQQPFPDTPGAVRFQW